MSFTNAGEDIYYEILQIPTSSNFEEIAKAYRRLKQQSNEYSQEIGPLIELAYDILTKSKREQMENHAKSSEDQIDDSFYSENESEKSFDVIEEEKCNSNLELNEIDLRKFISDSESSETDEKESQIASSPPPNEYDLWLTLEELYQGCTKVMKIQRKIVDPQDDSKTKFEEKFFNVRIKSGTMIGDRQAYPQQGDRELRFAQPADVIFIVKDIQHNKFKRIDKFDIEYTAVITREESQNGCELKIPTLENDSIMLMIDDEMIDEQTVERFSGRGLSYLEMGKKMRGDLVVKFKIVDENDKNVEEFKNENFQETQNINQQNSETELSLINEHDIEITLQEVYHGGPKEVIIPVKIYQENSSYKIEERNLTIDIIPGMNAGTKLSYPKQGDKLWNQSPRDLILIIRDKPNSNFTRDGSDIIHKVQITDAQIKNRETIKIPTLDNNSVQLALSESLKTKPLKSYHNRGLPFAGNSKLRGRLMVEFEIVESKEEEIGKINQNLENNCENIQKQFSGIKAKPMEKLAPNVYPLVLSLEEIFRGCQKNEKIEIMIIEESGLRQGEFTTLNVNVEPGSIDGTRIAIPDKGDRQYGKLPADVVFVVNEERNSIFKRNGFDIEYRAKVSSQEAICGTKLKIPTLDNSEFVYSIKGGITPDKVERIASAGLPVLNGDGKRGDFLIKFDIIFELDKTQDPPIEHDLMITLEQILHGCTKRVKINRRVHYANGTDEYETKILTIEVKPGTKAGKQFPFYREGDQNPGSIPADIIFTVRDKPHQLFRRNGDDIEYNVAVFKSQFKRGEKVNIPVLDEKDGPKVLSLEGIDQLNYVRRIVNCGLPNDDAHGKRGDLVVFFDVQPDKKTQDVPIERDLPLSLENILYGCTKRLKINRRIIDENGQEKYIDNIITIEIKPGTEEGTQFKFANMGDERVDKIAPDLIFIARDKPHKDFRRNGADIEYLVLMTKSEIQNDFSLNIPTLDRSSIEQKFKNICNENFVKRITNLGLPIGGDVNKRGDLVVRFDIVDDDRKDLPIRHDLPISLENVLHGCTKKMKIKRIELDAQGQEKEEEKIVQIEIKPGTPVGRRYTFSREGDQTTGRVPADVIFVTCDKAHSFFTRNSADLRYIIAIDESEASRSSHVFDIPTLESDIVKLNIDQVIKSDTIRNIPERGLPKSIKNPNVRGNIVVKFDIVKDKSENAIQSTQMQDSSLIEIENPTTEESNQQNEDKAENDVKVVDESEVKNKNIEQNNQNQQQQQEPQQEEPQYQDPPVFQDLCLVLEHVLFGHDFLTKFTRLITQPDGTTIMEDEMLSIRIEPGTLTETNIPFPFKGHRNPGRIPGDLIFITKDYPHPIFKRNSVHLEYTALVYASKCHPGNVVPIPVLGGHSMACTIATQIQPNTVWPLDGYGLPYPNGEPKRGILFVRFEIINDIQNYTLPTSSSTNQQICHPFEFDQNQQQQQLQTHIMPQNQNNFKQDPPIEYKLALTLEEVLHGCIKTKEFVRTVFQNDGTERIEQKYVHIRVDPGTPTGTPYVYPQESNQFPGRIPADFVFVTSDVPHSLFTRNGIDIEYTAWVPASQAGKNYKIQIPTLDRKLLKANGPFTTNTIYNYPEHGLPYPGDPSKRGQLVVNLQIVEDEQEAKKKSKWSKMTKILTPKKN